MKTRILYMLLASNFLCKSLFSQVGGLAISNAATLTNTLTNGTGIQITGSMLGGLAAGSATFGAGVPGMTSGVVLTTGDANNLGAANAVMPVSFFAGTPGISANTYDATTLTIEFSASCAGNLDIPFMFASDDYPYLAAKSFDDGIEIYIENLTAATPPVNLITLLGGVNIANINIANNAALFNANPPPGAFPFDGYTTVFKANHYINQCDDYRLTFVVYDGGDGLQDAALFLEPFQLNCNSFYAGPVVDAKENCKNGSFDICRTGPIGAPVAVNVGYGGAATNVDYAGLPAAVVIPAGNVCTTVPVIPIVDALAEPTEDLTINFFAEPFAPQCNPITMTLNIIDQFVYNAPNVIACANTPTPIGLPAMAGHTYAWTADPDLSSLIIANPLVNNPGGVVPLVKGYALTVTELVTGCVANDVVQVTFNPAPIANFAPLNVCLGTAMAFVSTSVFNSALPNVVNWNFGDGNVSVLPAPSHTYVNPGVYNVELLATNAYGCISKLIQPVTVWDLPVADFAIGNACQNTPFAFVNTSVPSVAGAGLGGSIWDFGDPASGVGNFSALAAPVQVYNTPGNYNVSLIQADANGCFSIVNHTLTVYPEPQANFSVTNACFGNNTVFTDLSTISFGNIVQWDWTYNNAVPLAIGVFNTVIPGVSPSFLFPVVGAYSADLMVTSNMGCQNTINIPFVVHPKPVANFASAAAVSCQNSCVNFMDLSFDPSGSALSYLWDFGPTQSSNVPNPTFCFNNSGLQNVGLTVTNMFGCSDQLINIGVINVLPTPEAAFDIVNSGTPNSSSINLTDLSVGNIAQWDWAMGNGDVLTFNASTNPNYVYQVPGDYMITLEVTEVNGCKHKIDRSIHVDQHAGYIPNAFTPQKADGTNDVFFPKLYMYKNQKYTMEIYNRWGERIWRTENSQPWDGKDLNTGKLVKQDVYIYRVKFQDDQGDIERVGHVTVVH